MNRIVLVVATVFVAIAMALVYMFGKSQANQAKADLEVATNTIAATNSNLDLARAEVRALEEALHTAERERDDIRHELTRCQLKHIGSFIDEQCCKLLKVKTSNEPTSP